MIFSKIRLRNLMLFNKPFLSELYTSNALKCDKLLSNANDDQLILIVQIIHYIANGLISLPRNCYETLKKSQKLKFINKTFCSKGKTVKLLKSSREEKLAKLFLLNASFNDLFYPLFNELIVANTSKAHVP